MPEDRDSNPTIWSMQHELQLAAFGLDEDNPKVQRRQSKSHRANLLDAPVVVDVQDVRKSFRIPDRKVSTLTQRLAHGSARARFRELLALRGISFDVRRGEFFGIVGRNGSGKSTLLKIMASIYKADSGRIRVAGRLAPFIELGVGLNAELTARENVALNGVMMGLSRAEAARRLDAVLEFAELQDFVDLKLKNYSSGMTVRLAFSVMVQSDPDVMLVDEVLAVGDASFGEKCLEIFRERRRNGKTLVLVTHDMMTVESFCDRAMLLHDGEQRYLGEPNEAILRYYRLNFGGGEVNGGSASGESNVSLLDVWLEDADGRRIEDPLVGQRFRFNLVAEARQDLKEPAFGFQVLNVDDLPVFGFGKALVDDDDEPVPITRGQRVRIVADVENKLVPGRYSVLCTMARSRARGDTAMHDVRVAEFLVKGSDPLPGMVVVGSEVQATLERVTVE